MWGLSHLYRTCPLPAVSRIGRRDRLTRWTLQGLMDKSLGMTAKGLNALSSMSSFNAEKVGTTTFNMCMRSRRIEGRLPLAYLNIKRLPRHANLVLASHDRKGIQQILHASINDDPHNTRRYLQNFGSISTLISSNNFWIGHSEFDCQVRD